ncbi:MAG: hypothetical protein ABIN37_01340, partial [Burkholderiaceae bacterium]
MLITFYSFKGGVGRSMALANVARWLQRNGLRVVVVDWDLEAPGIESFFVADPSIRQRIRSLPGLMDLFTGYLARWAQLPWPASPKSASDSAAEPPSDPQPIAPADRTQRVAMLRAHLPPLRLALQAMPGSPDPDMPPNTGGLWLLSAGARDAEQFARYADNVQSFDWARLYSQFDGEVFFDWFREQLNSVCDIALIDSRTGVTEMGGICTRHLADIVIGLCAPNEANLAGIERIIDALFSDRLRQARRDRSLEVVPIPARIDRQAENTRRNEWRDDFIERMSKRLGVDAQPFWELHIPYVPIYAFEEKLVVGEADSNEDLERAYIGLGSWIARRFARASDASVRQALLARTERQDNTVYELLYSAELVIDSIWQAVPKAQHEAARRLIMRWVLSPNDGAEIVPTTVHLDLLDPVEHEAAQVLSELGLLRQQPSNGRNLVQWARDDFVQWPQLGKWWLDDQEFLVWRQQLDSFSSAWLASGERDDGLLIGGEALAIAEAHAAQRRAELLSFHQKFVAASRSFANRQQQDRNLVHDLAAKQRAFVIRGFGKKKDKDGQVIDFEQVHTTLIAPALVRCGLAGSTTVEVSDPGNIRADMFALILEADIVICDITVHNANVFYELGV